MHQLFLTNQEKEKLFAAMDTNVQVSIPNHLKNAIPNLQAMFDSTISTTSSKLGSVEVEGRFGHSTDCGGFSCGVSQRFMENCLQRMETFPDWINTPAWQDTYDYFYDDKKGNPMRTTTGSTGGVLTHIRKMPLQRQQFLIEEPSQHSPSHVRVGVSCEIPVAEEDIPDVVAPKYVRRKLRKAFQMDHWTFDFTKTWSGKTKAEVDEVFTQGESPVYEMEIEILDIQGYLKLPHHNSMYTAISLLLKICDLLPQKAPRLLVVQ